MMHTELLPKLPQVIADNLTKKERKHETQRRVREKVSEMGEKSLQSRIFLTFWTESDTTVL